MRVGIRLRLKARARVRVSDRLLLVLRALQLVPRVDLAVLAQPGDGQ